MTAKIDAAEHLSPLHASEYVRSGVTEYLTTSFSLGDAHASHALASFLAHPATGMFRGPYVRTKLPFAQDTSSQQILPWLPEGFRPYQHQAAAFARLHSINQDPSPTMVVTGTGSGKTESFLYPMLNHVLQNPGPGIKALILYPMNALATDQAGRLAQLIASDERLQTVRAGIYTGETSEGGARKVSAESLITDRGTIRKDPPDILLTNYKMLDQLLLDAKVREMWQQSANSLQYVALDEFHTYDGAQGTDVALLLRRLGILLGRFAPQRFGQYSYYNRGPLGPITPVATSATMGSEDAKDKMLEFAETIFGMEFPADAIVQESLLTLEQWQARLSGEIPEELLDPRAVLNRETIAEITTEIDEVRAEDHVLAVRHSIAQRLLGCAGEDIDVIVACYGKHPWIARVLEHCQQPIALAELTPLVFPRLYTPQNAPELQAFTGHLITFIADVRARLMQQNPWVGRSVPGVENHLWIREVSRIERALGAPEFRWADDGHVESHDGATQWLPACYCRNCGRSGWMSVKEPNTTILNLDGAQIRSAAMQRPRDMVPLIDASAEYREAQAKGETLLQQRVDMEIAQLHWFDVREQTFSATSPSQEAVDENRMLPVLSYTPNVAEKVAKQSTCPACGEADAIRFVGSKVSTLLSVALSNLFGMPGLNADEKKTLIFSDSVQDAAYRAGFVQSRARIFTLRAQIHNQLRSQPQNLVEVTQAMLQAIGKDYRARYEILPRDIAHYKNFRSFWNKRANSTERKKAEAFAMRRLQFDITSEFSQRAERTRSLVQTGSASVAVDIERATLLNIARTAVHTATQQQVVGSTEEQLVQWARGIVEQVRLQGGIYHEYLQAYLQDDCNSYLLNNRNSRAKGVPSFGRGVSPRFPRTGSKYGKRQERSFIAADAATGNLARWTSKVLGLHAQDSARVVARLLKELEIPEVVQSFTTSTQGVMHALRPEKVMVSVEDQPQALVCSVCTGMIHVHRQAREELLAAPCMLPGCTGNYEQTPIQGNYYRDLYQARATRAVIAAEHTSLLPTKKRQELEDKFKAKNSLEPDTPNVLVATPTLEMGIDIGSLSTVMLSSMPDSVANYVQRVGRAGRLSGNSLVLSLVQGRGKTLPKWEQPLSMIAGNVAAPAAYLGATEILRRQLFAAILDEFSEDLNAGTQVRRAKDVFSTGQGYYLREVLNLLENQRDRVDQVIGDFLGAIDVANDVTQDLQDWITAPANNANNAADSLASTIIREQQYWQDTLTVYEERRRILEQRVKEEFSDFESGKRGLQRDEAEQEDYRQTLLALKFTNKLITEHTGQWWVSALEAAGLLPNFTLLDDTVDLQVAVSSFDPSSAQSSIETREYSRGISSALVELAPGATFYAQGVAARIDTVEAGAQGFDVQHWRVCPHCSHVVEEAASGGTTQSCPKCGDSGWGDVRQRISVVPMQRVSAEAAETKNAITDLHDERQRTHFTTAMACDIPPRGLGESWYTQHLGFGVSYLREVHLRWLNLGIGEGAPCVIGGREVHAPLFEVCATCGHVVVGEHVDPRWGHKRWCSQRQNISAETRRFALGRTLKTQGAFIHLPKRLQWADRITLPSFIAAIRLGMKEVLGGDPDNIVVGSLKVALGGQPDAADTLLLHDTVPGGTGYLSQFTSTADVRRLLEVAYAKLVGCSCAQDDVLCCSQCLLPYVEPGQAEHTSREVAVFVLGCLLADQVQVAQSGQADADSGAGLGAGGGVGSLAFPAWKTKNSQPQLSIESALEVRFRNLLREELQRQNFTLEDQSSALGTTTKVIAPNGRDFWILEEQKALGFSRPDFYLDGRGSGNRSIAIYTDGAQFHLQGVQKDLDDREQVRLQRGDLVWSVTWKDLDDYEVKKEAAPLRNPRALQQSDMVNSAQLEILCKDPLRQLVHLLQIKDEATRTGLARHVLWEYFSRPATQKMISPDGAIISGQVEVAIGLRAPQSVILSNAPLQHVECYLDTTQHNPEVWNTYLRLANLLSIGELQVHLGVGTLSDFDVVADSGISHAVTPAAESVADMSAEWQELFAEFADEEDVQEALQALHQAGVAAPDRVDEELGGIPVVALWDAAKVGLGFETETAAGYEIFGLEDHEDLRAALGS